MRGEAILLLAHGAPRDPADVPEFLRNVTGGRELPAPVVAEVRRRYALVGGSPLTEITLRQAEAIARASGLPTYVGMRNWRPTIGEAVAQMRADGVRRAAVICLAPHNSRTSVGLYRRALEAAAPDFTTEFIESWHDEPLLIAAFAERLREGWRRACAEAGVALPVLFTAHSVPVRGVAEGDPYAEQTRATAQLIAAAAPEIGDQWSFAYQSQGMSGGEWLGPRLEEQAAVIASSGAPGFFVQPVGFLADNVEILYDIDSALAGEAERIGLRLWRAPSLNDSEKLAQAIAHKTAAILGGESQH